MQLKSVHKIEQLKAEIRVQADRQMASSNRAEVLIDKLQILAAEGRRIANEEKILQSLRFDEWKRRFSVVRKAHKQTFEWMLENSEDASIPPTGFKEWLQSQDGIYWIAGKAGSGKSTLMKYLSESPIVIRHLQNWAGPDAECVLIPWFFWSAGSPMQRSQEGLFQSLLFQIMRRCPWLIPITCSARWRDDSVYGDRSDPWTLEELSATLDTIAHQPLHGIRFCIFIDGLDEYEGLPNEIIRVFKHLATSSSIKLCLSSRPWNEFLTAFDDGKCDGTLRLERFARPDIELFVKDILENDECFTAAERQDKRYNIFVYDVIDRAEGVFLWVQLAVTRLLKGLGERNRLEDLQRKLDTVPPTLEKFFQQIFHRIDEADWTESAQVFLITTHAVQALSVAAYHFLEKEGKEPGYAMKATVQPISSVKLEDMHRKVRDRLNFLCKDLLEVNQVTMDATFIDYQVDFLHRTVRDFLMTKEMHQQLMQRATQGHTTEWNAHRCLCHIALARAKALPLQDGIRPGLNILFALVDELMFYAHEIEIEHKVSQAQLLEEFDRVISAYANADMVYHWTNARDPPTGLYFEEANRNCFLALAIQSRLTLYVTEKLDGNRNLLHAKEGRPFLDYALRPNIVTPTKLPHHVEYIDFDMVRMLLNKGANPNQSVSIYGNITVWGLFLLSCYERKDTSGSQSKGTWFQAVETMIRKGADRKLKLESTQRGIPNRGRTAKFGRAVSREITALGILEEIFGASKTNELEAIVPEAREWSIWNVLGWK